MKKKLILMALAVAMALDVSGQVVFSKFVFKLDSPLGCCPGRKMTDAKFKVTSNKAIKTLDIEFVGVDQVGDAVCSDIVGAVNANVTHTKYKTMHNVGPFEPGKQYSRWTSGAFHYPTKLTAFPRRILIDYMDRSRSDTIDITRDNIGVYFPKIKWMDVDYEHGFQPSN